jgi:NYN domain
MSATPKADSVFPDYRGQLNLRPAGQGTKSPVSRVRRLRTTSFRWRFPERSLHVVDIENLAGAAVPSLALAAEVQGRYFARLDLGMDDQVVMAASHLGLLDAARAWPHARYRVRSGKDGADLELIDVLEHENVAARFSHVVIGSGDGIFGRSAASLAARGVRITVVSRQLSLAPGLARVASDVIYLDGPLTIAA